MFIAQTTQPVQVFGYDATDILVQVAAGVIVLLGGMAVRWLRAKSLAALEEQKTQKLQGGEILLNRVKTYMLGTAAAILEKRAQVLADKVLKRQITNPQQAKEEMYQWGDDLKAMTVEYFRTQGVDLLREIGDKSLDGLVERAANQVSPFPGMETARVIVQPKAAKAIVERGVEYTRKNADQFAVNYDEIKL